ncbi:MAG: hemin receptor [Flavobacteriaceae bacterium]|jgi:hypothetical protein|nr:hemin receptor [Flavobacteriaceae bacterium]
MTKKILIGLSISAACLVQAQDISNLRNTVDVYSNSGMNGTAKYQGMAGSMGALGGDFSTLNSNPAGIGVSIANDLSLTLNVTGNKNVSNFLGNPNSYSINKTDIGNTGGVVVFQTGESSKWKFVNFGVNYSYQSIENYIETGGNTNITYEIFDGGGNSVDNLTFGGHYYDRYGNLSKLSFGIAGNYDNKIYAGIGLNFHSATLEQYDTAGFITETGSRNFYDKQYTPFSETSNGFSASVGAIAKVNQNFRVGLALETPTWWNISRGYDYYEEPDDGSAVEDRNLSTPFKATVSAAFVANKNFSMNVDYTLGLSKPKYNISEDPEAETDLNNFFKDNYKSLSELKIGAEYRIADFRLRAGYAFSGNPFDAVSVSTFSNSGIGNRSYNNLILGKRNTIAAGLGYDFKIFYIDAAYQNITSKYSNQFMGATSNHSGYFGPNYIVDSPDFLVSDVKNTQNIFIITLGWKF